MKRIGIKAQLILTFFSFAFIIAVEGGFSIFYVNKVVNLFAGMYHDDLLSLEKFRELEVDLSNLRLDTFRYLGNNYPDHVKKMEREILDRGERIMRTLENGKDELSELKRLHRRNMEINKKILDLHYNFYTEEAYNLINGESQVVFDQLITVLLDITHKKRQKAKASLLTGYSIKNIIIGIMFGSILFCAFLLYWFYNAYRRVEMLEAESRRLNQIKDEFLANTSHELRTPLHGIIGLAENLIDRDGGTLSQKAVQSLNTIVSSSKRLSSLINDILDFSRIKNKELQLEKKPVDIRNVIDIVFALVRPATEIKNLKLRKEVPEDLILVYGDENRLQQILLNLVSNSIKFTHEGSITVEVRQEGDMARISVSDTGIGISSENYQKIFEAFEQVDRSITRRYGGTGLGLTVSKQLIELHGGTIDVQSIERVGSVFSFTIPISSEAVDSAKTGDTLFTKNHQVENDPVDLVVEINQPEPDSSDPVILIVDDEPVNLRVLEDLMLLNNYSVITAQDGIEALQVIEEEQPDLVLLDLMMPRMSGYEVCRKLREQFSPTALPIVLLTAIHEKQDLIRGLNCGANDFLSKPIVKEELLARIKVHLQIKRNEELEHEIKRRQKAEQQLQHSTIRMTQMLDNSRDAIVSFDFDRKINYINQKAEMIFSCRISTVIGRDVLSILPQKMGEKLIQYLEQLIAADQENKDNTIHFELEYQGKGNVLNKTDALLRKVETETLSNIVLRVIDIDSKEMILQNISQVSTGTPDTLESDLLGKLSRAGSINLQTLELALDGVLKLLSGNETDVMEKIRDLNHEDTKNRLNLLTEDGLDTKIRKTIIELMYHALNYWELDTQKTRVELAEESGLWNVTLEKAGVYRTQTLNKYLKLETLPKHPRWKQVVKTVRFILENTGGHTSGEVAKIRELLTELLDLQKRKQLISQGKPVFSSEDIP